MTENFDNFIVEHLRAIRAEVDHINVDVSVIKMRLSSIDERLTLVEKATANIHGDMAMLQLRLDHQGDCIERIENRLELTAA